MKIIFYTFGDIKNAELKALSRYYLTLNRKYHTLDLTTLKDTSQRRIGFAQVEKRFSAGLNIVLSERGQSYTTRDFAGQIDRYSARGLRLNFYVGNAFGFTDEVEKKADLLLSLSSMTTAHELALVVMLEQLYRVSNLLAGGKYHK
ncbi:MAG: 23S rRNA (pseudouridine(1915)-N(3))-methyltransferase RlmH [Deltaproteobacteria bacterium]|nr:23S rRNA (pseudouridine(1915)-N(3))-methyltransferase RlmH [Deltaproteobacteria bacterium]